MDTLNQFGEAIQKSQKRIERCGRGVIHLIDAQKEKSRYNR